ncbi:hypothetical protein FB451DRAFT_175457 [Mycena latifolia]|nr:hypothetical protein FB451DRAFT_175457 [Mycena latifolia]
MMEYDYSPQARAKYDATQRRIAAWARATPSGPQLKSPFAPSSTSGSGSGSGSGYGYAGPSAYRAPTHHTYRAPTSHAGTRSQGRAPSVTPSESISQAPSRLHHTRSSHSSSSHHSSSHHSRSQASYSSYSSPSSHSRSSSSHHSRSQASYSSSHGRSAPSAYVVATPGPGPSAYVVAPPPGAAGTGGVIILPRRGHAPRARAAGRVLLIAFARRASC